MWQCNECGHVPESCVQCGGELIEKPEKYCSDDGCWKKAKVGCKDCGWNVCKKILKLADNNCRGCGAFVCNECEIGGFSNFSGCFHCAKIEKEHDCVDFWQKYPDYKPTQWTSPLCCRSCKITFKYCPYCKNEAGTVLLSHVSD